MSEDKFYPETILKNYEMRTNTMPSNLRIGEHGFLQDDKHLFAFRRSKEDISPDGALLTDLYNGQSADETFNATEGHGLYVANAAAATKVPGIKGDNLYCVRLPLDSLKILDSINVTNLSENQQKAARLHRIRSRMIGVPNPGTKIWDKWYEDTEIVTFRPMAMARTFLGRTVQLDAGGKVIPTWAIIRDTDKAEIVGKKYKIPG